jgi:hypothetical protein
VTKLPGTLELEKLAQELESSAPTPRKNPAPNPSSYPRPLIEGQSEGKAYYELHWCSVHAEEYRVAVINFNAFAGDVVRSGVCACCSKEQADEQKANVLLAEERAEIHRRAEEEMQRYEADIQRETDEETQRHAASLRPQIEDDVRSRYLDRIVAEKEAARKAEIIATLRGKESKGEK